MYVCMYVCMYYMYVCIGSKAHIAAAGVINVAICFLYKLSGPTSFPHPYYQEFMQNTHTQGKKKDGQISYNWILLT